jgi:ABC-type multidrug transport system fused ATPase/permease subunit
MEAVKQLAAHMTVIIITHRLTTVQGCDTIFVLDGGRLTGQGTLSELHKSTSMFLAQA